MTSLKKIDYFLIISFLFLPIILHLNEINLRQYEILTINYLIIFQLIISLSIFIFSLSINFFFIKKKIFSEILLCNFIIFYFLFYYKKINSLKIIQYLEEYHYLLDNLVTIIFFLIFYILIFLFLKRLKYFAKIFLLFFVIFNFIYGFYNMNPIKNFQISMSENYVSKNKIEINSLSLPTTENKSNVYLIVLDGMIDLEKANDLKIIQSKSKIIKQLENQNYKYNSSFKSNYSVTYASIQSLLYGDFPIDENSTRYKNRLGFYPYIMSNKQNFFYQIINRLDMNFFWIGNKWGLCKGLKFGECFYNYTDKRSFLTKLIFSSELFYLDSIFSYFFNYLNKDIVITAFDFLRYSQNQNQNLLFKDKTNFFLIHVYKPHKPYNLDQDCKDIQPRNVTSNEIDFYKDNYNCALKAVLNWDQNFLNKDRNNIVIVLGDHGWSFNNNNKKDIEFTKSRINDVFFAYKVPKSCNSIDIPNSHVNVMRFILRCLQSSNPEYLTDTQYILRYEGHEDYGTAIKLKKND